MKNVKSYRVFATQGYCLGVFLMLPIVMLGLQVFTLVFLELSISFVSAALLCIAGIFFDQWAFGGICAKEMSVLDYFKTSIKGTAVIQEALVVDCILHFLSMMITLIASEFLAKGLLPETTASKESMMMLFTSICLSYSILVLGTSVARYFTLAMWNWTISMFGTLILSGLMVAACILIVKGHIWVLPVSIILAIGFSIFSVKNVMRKVRRSYYDETVKTGMQDA